MTAPQPAELSLHRKLSEAMGAIDWQPKTGRNQQQGYNFVSVERIKDSVRTELAKRFVMVYVSTKAVDRTELETRNGGVMHRVGVQGEVTFADGDSGEMFTIEAAGEAMDSGDKALSKAQTAMVKNALIDTFLIPTGDDPDQETVPEQQPAKREYGRASFPKDEKPATARETAAEPFRPLGGGEVPEDGQPEPPRPLPRAGMVQCESRSPYDYPAGELVPQCRREKGHTGAHRTQSESWSDADAKSVAAANQRGTVA